MELVEWNRYFRGRSRLDALVARASAADRKPIFMVGSGLSLPDEPGGPGVPGTAGMVELVRQQVSDDQAALDELNRQLERAEQDNASVYGAAFTFLRDWRGPDAANQVIFDAVRMARLPGARQSDDAQALESDLEGWALTRGTSALGFLLAGHRQSYPGPVLTTNFDPLLSVAISRARGHPRRAILDGDGRLPSAAELGPDVIPVIHLHGYWWGSDTHHTGMELSASRPQLGASLARLLNERLVVVVGYGGWDDAFMQAVSSLLDDTGARPDIAWALYDDDPGMIFTRHAPLLDHFERWRFRPRFTLYVGIDANKFFQKLLERAIGSEGSVDPDGRPSTPPLAEVRRLRQDYGRRTPAEVKPEPRVRESQTQIFAVVDALLTLEAIADEGARREVLRLLPAEIAGAIPHHAVPRVQVLAIVRTCLSYEGGLRELLKAVRAVERDSVGMRELDDTMNNAFPGYLTG